MVVTWYLANDKIIRVFKRACFILRSASVLLLRKKQTFARQEKSCLGVKGRWRLFSPKMFCNAPHTLSFKTKYKYIKLTERTKTSANRFKSLLVLLLAHLNATDVTALKASKRSWSSRLVAMMWLSYVSEIYERSLHSQEPCCYHADLNIIYEFSGIWCQKSKMAFRAAGF